MGKLISKADIFSKKGLDPKEIEVPEWGGRVIYKPMSMVERREVRKKCSELSVDSNGQTKVEMDAEKLEVMTLIYCVLNPSDAARKRLLFGPDDIKTLEEEMCAGGISTVAQAILRDSGMTGNATFRGEETPKE